MEGLPLALGLSTDNGGWGGWGGALIGGAIGGAIGSGIWGGNRGRGCNDGCCGDQFIMDSLSGLRSDVGSIGRDNLMQTAMQEAMPWAVSYATQKRLPRIDQVERLCTQLLAIVIASTPDSKPDNSDSASKVLPFS